MCCEFVRLSPVPLPSLTLWQRFVHRSAKSKAAYQLQHLHHVCYAVLYSLWPHAVGCLSAASALINNDCEAKQQDALARAAASSASASGLSGNGPSYAYPFQPPPVVSAAPSALMYLPPAAHAQEWLRTQQELHARKMAEAQAQLLASPDTYAQLIQASPMQSVERPQVCSRRSL